MPESFEKGEAETFDVRLTWIVSSGSNGTRSNSVPFETKRSELSSFKNFGAVRVALITSLTVPPTIKADSLLLPRKRLGNYREKKPTCSHLRSTEVRTLIVGRADGSTHSCWVRSLFDLT
ncbi:unnamed protein product [Calicophoron daubneyi]|uniref:Uncharacterized protein n=1 Tax=Calicophoron daubneyi TaxID=300641 RepID=A0AAV2TQP2_CALDB